MSDYEDDLIYAFAMGSASRDDEIDRLRAENEAWIEAFGVLTTLHEKMLIDTANPMGMAKQVEAHVRQRIAELEAAPVVARMHPEDGRIISEKTYAHGAESGGAAWSSVKGYTIKLLALRGEGG